MPELLHPGVYVQEVPPAVRPIEGVSTSTAAFIGVADKGPVPGGLLPSGRAAQPALLTSFTDYRRQFGEFRRDSFLAYAARAFFDNGGRRLYIARVVGDGAARAALGGESAASSQLSAAQPGAWSSLLGVSIENASGGDPAAFNLRVTAAGQNGGVVELERFENLSVAGAQSAINTGAGASKFVRLSAALTARPQNSLGLAVTAGNNPASAVAAGGSTPDPNGIDVQARAPGTWANDNQGRLAVAIAPATNGVATSFDLIVSLNNRTVERFTNLVANSAAPPSPVNYARTVVNAGSRYVTITADFTARPTDGEVALTGGTNAGGGGTTATWGPGSLLEITAANEGAWGNAILVSIADSSDLDPDNFKLLVHLGDLTVETYDNVTFRSGAPTDPDPENYAPRLINSRSEFIALLGTLASRPANGGPVALAGGADGAAPTTQQFIGQAAADNTVAGTGLHAFDKLTDVNLVAIPGRGDAQTVNAGMEYCKNRPLQDCFFIGDVGLIEDVNAARLPNAQPQPFRLSDARLFATTGFNGTPLNKSAGDYGAIYYPWVWSADPIGVGRNPQILLPPSGFLAGIYARIDNSRGVFKAPAGTEAGVAGVLAPVTPVSDTEQDQLNPIMVNVVRTVPGSGIVVWGTRTVGSDAAWRYIPVRRMAIFLRVSIYYGIQWAVFEPNDEPLWASLRLNIRAFMLTQFRAGAFQGAKPDDAFFVKCDGSTTTQQDIDNGVVNILVGFAPLKPAEFVVLRLSQKVNQPAV